MQKLAEICIRRPVFATMLIMALVVVGGFCYTKLGVDLFPKVDFPTVTVTTVLPGASPEEVETEITKKIEEAVNTISGIDELRSVSSEGISQVFVTFILERDGDEAAQDVRDRVGRILGNLPREIDPPVIEKIDPDAQPVVSIAVSGNSPAREITEIADKQIKQQIESLNGVGQVRFIGDRKREIQVWLNPDKLMSYGLTIDEVRRSLAAQNIEIPGGRVDAGIQELTLRTLGRVKRVEDFNEIVLKVVNGSPVRVADVGTVEDGIEEPRSLARVDGKEAVVLEVRKQSGTNTLAVVEAVKERLAEILPMFMLTGKDFIPQDDQSQFEVNVRAPEGTSLQGSTALVNQLEGELKSLPGVEFVLSTVGADSQQRVNFITLFLQLVPMHDRDESQQEIMQQARRLMAKYGGDLRVAVQYPAAISGGGIANADLLYTVRGPDLQKLTEYSEKIRQVVKQIPGVVDVDSSLEVGKPEIRAHINRDKAADLGLSVQDIASSLRTMVAGEEVSSFQEGDDRYEVRLRVAAEHRRSAETVTRLYIPSARGGNVQLSSVVTLDEAAQIERHSRQRQVTISGNIDKGQSLSEVLARLEPEVQKLDMGPAYQTGLLGRSRELGRAASSFVVAFVLSFLFMYMILAAQFESFLHPITILLSLPMAIPFALLSLLAFGQTLNVFSSLGILMLFGVVKKNSILQIDHMNNLRHEGLPRYEAIIQACRDRLRPILMTTFALVAGMLPMALGTGVGSGVRRSVAIIVIGGQMLCLLLTLLAIPVAYSLFDDLATSPLWGRLAIASEVVTGRFRRRLAGAVSSLFG